MEQQVDVFNGITHIAGVVHFHKCQEGRIFQRLDFVFVHKVAPLHVKRSGMGWREGVHQEEIYEGEKPSGMDQKFANSQDEVSSRD